MKSALLLFCLLLPFTGCVAPWSAGYSRDEVNRMLEDTKRLGYASGSVDQENANHKQAELDNTVSAVRWLYWVGLGLIVMGLLCFFMLPVFKKTAIAEVVAGFALIIAARTLIVILPYAHWIGIGALVIFVGWRLWQSRHTLAALGAVAHGVEDFASKNTHQLIDAVKKRRPTSFFKRA